MNIKTMLMSAALAFVLAACDETDPPPAKEFIVLPLRMEMEGYRKEFTADVGNRVTEVKTSSYFPDNVVLESNLRYVYGTHNRIERAIADTGYRLEYTYQGDKIVRTDEFINDTFSQYHTFTYDAGGRVHEFVTWQDVPEEGGLIAKAKTVFLYDARDNLALQMLYYYNSAIRGLTVLQSFEYGDYDQQPDAEGLFAGQALHPQMIQTKNNPGKMMTINRHGVTLIVDQYEYEYNSRGYVTKKTTTTVFSQNGNTGSYDTWFFYQDRRK